MPDPPSTKASRRKRLIKAGLLAAFILAAVAAVRGSPLREVLTAEALQRFLDAAGPWAPLVFVGVYAAGVCLFVPGTVLTGLGAAIFGAYWGFLYVWLGAMLGASAAFGIGRTLGRDFAASLIGERLRRYDDAIARNGFATVLYLRLIYFPFTPLNFGMGLTGVSFRDYFWGTGLGILVGTFVLTFLIGTLKEVWVSGDWGRLLSGQVALALALFGLSFGIPALVRRWRGSR